MKYEKNKSAVHAIKVLCSIAVFVCGLYLSFPAEAAGTYTEPGSTSLTQYWSNPVKCHTISNADGSVTIMYSVWDGTSQTLHIDRFSSTGSRISGKSVAVPGETWGGTVYRGPDGCNYIATGNGPDAAFYISKYSADWNFMGTASIGKEESYTMEAFAGGNSDMTMVGDYLIVRVARQRLDYHQSDATFVINKNTMQPIYVAGEDEIAMVSHSFSQFVRSDGNQVIMLDHGDGNPRGIVLQKGLLNQTDGSLEEQYLYKENESNLTRYYFRNILYDIKGKFGQNYTGVTVDGFELGSFHHVVTGTSIPHDTFPSNEAFGAYEGGNNVYVILVNKDLQSSSMRWLTAYNNVEVSNLEMVKINDDRFLLLYGTEDEKDNTATCYMLIDSNGNVQQSGSIPKTFYCTSEPSVYGNVITWCHYVESELGNFLVMNRWDMGTGAFHVYNLDIGIPSKITKIDSVDLSVLHSEQEAELTMDVYSDVFREEYPTAPAVWESSNPAVLEILDEESILSSGVTNRSYKSVYTRVRAKKAGTAKVTCRIGDKKSTIKVKVSGKTGKLSFKKKKVTLKLGQSYQAKISGSNGNKVTWKSSDPQIAKVSKKGVITALRAGKVKITAKVGRKKAVLTVKVSETKWKPPKTEITRWKKAGGNKVKVFWKKKKGITGYQLSYAKNKNFKKAEQMVVKKAGQTSARFKKPAGTPCYVRVRSYKDAMINGRKVRLYSKWSAKRQVRLK